MNSLAAFLLRKISLRPLVALLATIHSALAVDPVWEPAPRADDFVDSIGVCTHWSYGNTPYAKAYDLVKQRLAESGIRHVRDAFYFREVELWHAYGIRDTAGSEPWKNDLEAQMTAWKANPGVIEMINVCFDITNAVLPDDSDALPLIFSTGYKIDYFKGGKAHLLPNGDPGGIAVFFKNNSAAFLIAQPEGVSLYPPAFGSTPVSDFDPKGRTYIQLTPDGPLP